MKFSIKKLNLRVLLVFAAILLNSCSKDSDDPTPQETPITVSTADFSKTMDENPTNGQLIGTVQGSTNEGSVTFSITEQTPAGAFAIDLASGELKVSDETLFDFETNPTITGTVKVANGTVSKNALVTITLNDLVEENIYDGDVILRSQQEVSDFGANNYTHITGYLVIGVPDGTGSSNISDLSPLNTIKRIDNYIQIIKNSILTSTSGLNIHYLVGGISITENPSLERIEGFNDITSILLLNLSNNDVLSDLSGLTQITEIQYNLSIIQCPLITNLDWLTNLTIAGNTITISSCDSLRNVNGLNNLRELTSESGSITVSYNDALENLDGLLNLNATLTTLYVMGNPLLQNISGLENIDVYQTLKIIDNNLLQSLQGLEKVTRNFSIISIVNNNSLIELQGLNNLSHTYGEFNIRNNGGLTSLNGLNGLLNIWQIRLLDNTNLLDFCALQNAFTINGQTFYTATGNAYNPTKQDIIDGNCSL